MRLEIESQHFAQAAFQYLLIRTLAAAIEPALELADADRVLGLGLLDANGNRLASAKHCPI
jgi:hypothetical protein